MKLYQYDPICTKSAMRRGIAAMVTPFIVWAIELAVLPHNHSSNTNVVPSIWTIAISGMCFVASVIAVMVSLRTLVRIRGLNTPWNLGLVLGFGVALNALVLIFFAVVYSFWYL